MAKKREVNIIIDGKNKAKGAFLSVKKGLQEVGETSKKATTTFSRNFSRMNRTILSFSDKLKFMDKIAKRTFQGTAAASAIYAVTTLRSFAQLEDGISKVNTLYDQTKESQRKMTQDSMQMFKLIPTDFQKITQGIYDTISAGADPQIATMYARKFGMASVAGMTDMPVVTKAAMGTMNAFGKEASDLNHILDIQFLTVKRGITEYSQLASSLDTGILKAADSAGMSMEQLYGGIAQITKNGIPAAQATTQLGSILARVTDPKVIKSFKSFGVSLQDNHHKTRSLVEIVKDLNEQFEKRKMTGAQQAGFLKEVLGRQEAVRGFQTLISQAKEYGQIVDEMNGADGTMNEAFRDRLDNINTQLKLIWNNFLSYGVENLEKLKPFLDALTEPLIKKQQLQMEKADLEDQYRMMTGRDYEEDMIKESLESIGNTKVTEQIKNQGEKISIFNNVDDLVKNTKLLDMLDQEKKPKEDSVKDTSIVNVLDQTKNSKEDKNVSFDEKIRDQIRKKDIEIDEIDLTPMDKFKDALEESTDKLKEASPIIGSFIETIGGFMLNFVGEEGESFRNGAKNIGIGLGSIYGMKKMGDMYMWFRRLLNKANPKGTPSNQLTKTMQTMNVNAKVVNVYGKSINNMGGSPISGKPTGASSIPIVPVPPSNPLILTKPIPKLQGSKTIPRLTSPQGGVAEGVKSSAIAFEGAVAAKEAMTAFLKGVPVLAAAGIQLYKEYGKNKKRDEGLKKVDKNSYATTDYGIVSGKEIKRLQKIPTTIQPKESFVQSLMNTLKGVFGLDNSMKVENQVKVDPPKVTNKIYVDSKEIPIKRSETTFEKIDQYQERQYRRYGSGR